MQDNKYLTDELKQYYTTDFQKLINLPSSDFWSLDKDLKATLISINSNRNIQTLYSKRFNPQSGALIIDKESYIVFAFKRDIKAKLRGLISRFENTYLNKLSAVLFEPKPNANYSGQESQREIGCLTSPNYFQVYHYRISFNDDEKINHDNFWKDIEDSLSRLN